MGATRRKRPEQDGRFWCGHCEQWLLPEAFQVIVVRDKRCKPGHALTTHAYECRECSNERKRDLRRRKAEAAGKSFSPVGDKQAWIAERREAKTRRKSDNLAKQQAYWDECKAAREAIQSNDLLVCFICKATKSRSEFQPSRLTNPASVICRDCSSRLDAERFKKASAALSDSYVKHMISKSTGLRRAEIPTVMVEAKRAQLMLERAMPPAEAIYRAWLQRILTDGPLHAQTLNHLSNEHGFNVHDLRHVRRAVAAYDENTNTWSMK